MGATQSESQTQSDQLTEAQKRETIIKKNIEREIFSKKLANITFEFISNVRNNIISFNDDSKESKNLDSKLNESKDQHQDKEQDKEQEKEQENDKHKQIEFEMKELKLKNDSKSKREYILKVSNDQNNRTLYSQSNNNDLFTLDQVISGTIVPKDLKDDLVIFKPPNRNYFNSILYKLDLPDKLTDKLNNQTDTQNDTDTKRETKVKCEINPSFSLIKKYITLDDFKEKAKINFACIYDFPHWDKLVLAGGAVTNTLLQLNYDPKQTIKDLDLWPVGLSDKELKEMNVLLETHLQNYWKPFAGKLMKTSTSSAITYTFIPKYYGYDNNDHNPVCTTVQLILQQYGSISDVLHYFDLGSSSVAFDKENLFFTESAAIAFTENINFVNFNIKNPTREKRIVKYFNRGFSLALPHLTTIKIMDIMDPHNIPVFNLGDNIECKFIDSNNLITNFNSFEVEMRYADVVNNVENHKVKISEFFAKDVRIGKKVDGDVDYFLGYNFEDFGNIVSASNYNYSRFSSGCSSGFINCIDITHHDQDEPGVGEFITLNGLSNLLESLANNDTINVNGLKDKFGAAMTRTLLENLTNNFENGNMMSILHYKIFSYELQRLINEKYGQLIKCNR